eukprot:2983802-Rhodomonas_salina.4
MAFSPPKKARKHHLTAVCTGKYVRVFAYDLAVQAPDPGAPTAQGPPSKPGSTIPYLSTGHRVARA